MVQATAMVSRVAVAKYNRNIRVIRTSLTELLEFFENLPKYQQATERLRRLVGGLPPRL